MSKQLSVHLHGKQVGILEQTSTGKMSFSYDNKTSQALSISMPLENKAFNANQCEAFFGGFLPENEIAKKIIGKRYSVSPNNTFALLKAIGNDCAGAISFQPIDEPMVLDKEIPLSAKIVSDDELYEHIISLPQKPLFMDFEGLRLSLAGVQDKAAVCLIDNHIAIPQNNCPTTHILKPAIKGFDGIIENEYLCLEIASQIGLSIPQKEIRRIKDISFLLINRYDRLVVNNTVTRIHQEDFCQALGIISKNKYQNEGGPGFKDCFDLLRKSTQPAINRNMLAKVMVFNYLIGNTDAHGKNFSLLHMDNSQIALAPFYDLINTRLYPNLSSKMAMKIGGCYDAQKVSLRHWQNQCELIGYSFPAIKQLLKSIGTMIIESLETNREFYIEMTNNKVFFMEFSKFLKNNIEMTLKKLDAE